MTTIREVQNPRVRQLAEILKNNGLAGSVNEAVRMATTMTKTEDRVNDQYKRYQDKRRGIHAQSSSPEPERADSQEKEMRAQTESEQPAKSAPTHTNGAIADAISTVQQQFKSQESNRALGELESMTVAEAVADPPSREEPQAANTMQDDLVADAVESKNEMSRDEGNEESPIVAPAPQEKPIVAQPVAAEHTEQQPEHTEEIKTTPQKKDTRNNYEESKIDLSNVFNFSKH